MDDAAKIREVSRYLRRKYATDIDGLKALIDGIAEGGFEAVSITGQSYEGSNVQGQLVFEPLAYLKAAQDVLAELDPTNTPDDPPGVTHADFSRSAILT